jgi:hypothetical protein
MSRKSQHVLAVRALPPDVQQRLDEWTRDEELALRAAIVIARYRKQNSQNPTFSELFEVLARSRPNLSANGHQDPRVAFAFRYHVAVHWRRGGWIRWGPEKRSLRTGRTFRLASRDFVSSRLASRG